MTDVNVPGFPNLKIGFKGAANLTVEVDGLRQTAFLLARVTNVNLRKNLAAFHGRQIGILTQRARQYFESEKLRPDESGSRPNARFTGKFDFGSRGGGTFVGVPINDEANDQYGFGYPDIARADRRTHYVWRSLEFGLRPHPGAIKGPFSPIGSARFPKRFTFLPFTGRGRLHPSAAGSAATGTLVTPRGRIVARVKHPGIAPKLFITRAFEDTAANLVDGYSTVLGQTYKDFK